MLLRETLVRDLTNKELNSIKLYGEVLDIGGGDNLRYSKFIFKEFKFNYESINIDKTRNPTYLHDLNKKLILKKKYDFILAIHTVEHIKKFTNVLDFSKNLKKGGKMIIITPFLFRIHADPYDFNRLTYDFYDNYFNKKKFNIKIKPLGYGVFSTSFSLIEPIFNRFGLRVIGGLFRVTFILLDKFLNFISQKYKKYYGVRSYPVGYIVILEKK